MIPATANNPFHSLLSLSVGSAITQKQTLIDHVLHLTFRLTKKMDSICGKSRGREGEGEERQKRGGTHRCSVRKLETMLKMSD